MKICHLISGDLWAGAEVQAYTLITALSKENDITVIVLNNGKLAHLLQKNKINVYIVEESKNSFFKLRKKIVDIIDKNKIEILHTHRYKENILGAMIKKKCKIKVLISTIHGMQEKNSIIKNLKLNIYMLINYFFLRFYFDKCIAVSNNIKKELNKGLGDNKLEVIHNCIDVESIRQKEFSISVLKSELGIEEDVNIIGTVGRLVPIKGFNNFILIAKEIIKVKENVRFIIVGDGPLEKELKSQAKELDISSYVIFTGFKDNVLDYVNLFDIFLVTSLHEGIPMAVLEAMALNRVVVSNNVGGMPEIIDDNKNGFLVTPGNIKWISEKCLDVLHDKELYNKISNNSLMKVNQEFTITIMKNSVQHLYETLLKK